MVTCSDTKQDTFVTEWHLAYYEVLAISKCHKDITTSLIANSLVITQKGKSKTGVTREQRPSNFPENQYFLPPDTHTCVCISGGKKCFFFRQFDVICFLVTSILRFASLPYYQQIESLIFSIDNLLQDPKLNTMKAFNKNINFMKEKDNPYITFTNTKLYHFTSGQLVFL